MKRIFKYAYITALALAFSCNNSDDVVTENAKEGGLLEAASSSVNYVVGNPEGPYPIGFFVRQGDVKTTEVRLYKSFVTTETWTEIVDGEEVEKDSTFTSNEVLQETFNISNMESHHISTGYSFEQLTEGLQVASRMAGPTDLPNDDGEFTIGDRWVFRVESVLEDGRVVQQAAPVNVSVSTRYAGTYRAVAGAYYRIGVLTYVTSDWPDEIVIESVDATTYRQIDYWSAFPDNEFLFQIIDGQITYPDDQIINAYPMITCESDPSLFVAQANCGDSNYVINDDETGKDRLVMTNGYLTTGTSADGPRVMYQVLEKIVN
ncbi:MAG TPA: hypothetical protein VD927_04225 [Chryseosolibacter sp.]|nr:hypothetical protein [Chryseosolibacter sp.]